MKDVNVSIQFTGKGWMEFKINEFTARGSYLTDIPIDWLKAIKFSLENEVPFTLFMDEEGSEVVITAYYDHIIIYAIRDLMSIYTFEMNYKDFAIQLFNEFKKYKDSLYYWLPESSAYTEQELYERMKEIEFLFVGIELEIDCMG